MILCAVFTTLWHICHSSSGQWENKQLLLFIILPKPSLMRIQYTGELLLHLNTQNQIGLPRDIQLPDLIRKERKDPTLNHSRGVKKRKG